MQNFVHQTFLISKNLHCRDQYLEILRQFLFGVACFILTRYFLVNLPQHHSSSRCVLLIFLSAGFSERENMSGYRNESAVCRKLLGGSFSETLKVTLYTNIIPKLLRRDIWIRTVVFCYIKIWVYSTHQYTFKTHVLYVKIT